MRIIRDITPEEEKIATGSCYQRAFDLIAKLSDAEQIQALLVHGKIVADTPEGRDIRFPHAWVEIGENVYDLFKRKKKPRITQKDIYYARYLVSEVKKYTIKEMYKIGYMNGATKGPWK